MTKIQDFFLPALLIAAGVALMAVGIHRGEVAVLLTKAINICLECIGIG